MASFTQPARRKPHSAGKADRNPFPAAIASWTTHGAAVDASRATLDAPDPAAAMRKDLEVLAAAWQDRRKKLLSGDGDGDGGRGGDGTGAAALSAMTKEEAQALLGKASWKGDVAGMERAEAAGADVRAAVYYNDGSMGGKSTAAYVAAYNNNGAGLRFLGACGVCSFIYCSQYL